MFADLHFVFFSPFVHMISWIVCSVQHTNDPRIHTKATKTINTNRDRVLLTRSSYKTRSAPCAAAQRKSSGLRPVACS
jgi:hypothetical protein